MREVGILKKGIAVGLVPVRIIYMFYVLIPHCGWREGDLKPVLQKNPLLQFPEHRFLPCILYTSNIYMIYVKNRWFVTIFGSKEELSGILHQQIATGQETEQIRKEGEAT